MAGCRPEIGHGVAEGWMFFVLGTAILDVNIALSGTPKRFYDHVLAAWAIRSLVHGR
jgi:hypothetical protein